MRTVNVRRLIGLFVFVAFVAGATHWLHGYQVRRNVKMFLREAHRAQGEHRTQDTLENLSWYLRLVPEDTEVKTELGLLLADLGRNGPAFVTLEDVLRRDAGRADVRRRLVKVALELNRPGDARSHLERHLLPATPEDAELWELLGQCQEAQGAYSEALASWDRAIQLDAPRLEVHERRAHLLRQRLGRPQEADAALDRLVQENPEAAEVYVLRSRYWAESQQSEASLRDAQKALELKPDDREALELAARAALDQRHFDQAAQYAERALQLEPQQPRNYLTLSAVCLGRDDRAGAIQWLRRGLEEVPASQDLQWNLANTLLEDGDAAQTEALVRQLTEAEMPDALVAYLRARLLYVQRQWREAAHQLERLRPNLQEWPELVKQCDAILGSCYQRLGNADLQLTAYRRVLEADAFSGLARLGTAEALMALGRQDEALAEYRRVLESREAPAESWIPYVRLLVASTLRQPPAERQWEKVEEVLQQAAVASPDSSLLPIARAECHLAQGRVAEAERELAAASAKTPSEANLWEARIALAQRQGDWARVESLLEEARAAAGDRAGLRLARARYLLLRQGKEAAAALKQLAEEARSLPEAERSNFLRQLAGMSLEAGDYEQTEQLCRGLAEKEPNDVTIALLRFERARRAEDRPALEAALDQIERIEGAGPLWLYHRAIYLSLLDQGQNSQRLQEALEQLTQARVLRPAWSDVPVLAADLYLRQGKEDQALRSYLDAIELGNQSPAVIRRTVQLLYQKGRYPEASRVLRHLEEQAVPLSPEVHRVAAQVSLQLNEFDQAVAWARQSAEGSSDYRDHLWLGLVLGAVAQRTGQPNAPQAAAIEEAEKAFRRAVELDAGRSECWAAWVQFLAHAGQSQRAEQVLLEARQKLPPATAALVTAEGYDMLGRRTEAEQRYAEALSTLGEDSSVVRRAVEFYLRRGDYASAEPHLRKLVDGKIPAKEEEVRWARRNLALTLLAHGDYPSLQQAAELSRANLAVAEPAVDDLRGYALVLGALSQPERRREAVQILERLLAKQPTPVAEDRFVLAQLYLAQGDWNSANRQMRTLLASHGQETRYVAAYVRGLLDHQELGDVELWLTRLEQLAPSDARTAQLRAEYCLARRRFDEALRAWDAVLRSPAAPEDSMRTAGVAASIETLGMRLRQQGHAEEAARFMARAEGLYRQYVAERPEHILLLSSFWARQNRPAEAVANLESHWQGADADLLAAAVGTLLANTSLENEAIPRAERVLMAALEQAEPSGNSAKPASLLLTAADLRTVQRRYAEAEAFLRQVLAQESVEGNSQVMARNNLALLLAAQKKELPEARRLIDQALELAGPKAAYLDSRATICLAAGDAKQAAQDLGEALAQTPTAVRYFHLAQAQQRLGQTQEARQAWRRAEQMGLAAEQLHPTERDEFGRLQELLR